MQHNAAIRLAPVARALSLSSCTIRSFGSSSSTAGIRNLRTTLLRQGLPRIACAKVQFHLQQSRAYSAATAVGATSQESANPEIEVEVVEEGSGQKKVAIWLFICAGLCFLIVIVGGMTRLTESGLSITDWRPITGAMPPITDADWQREYDRYVISPEFLRQRDPETFSMSDFKYIFFWEWAHRQLGRTVGLVYALPWLYFSSKGAIPKKLQPRMAGLLALIGLQGTIGWIMVASGLNEKNFEDGSRVRVSHYRLTAHLMGAFSLYSAFLWTAMSLYRPNVSQGVRQLIKEAPKLRSMAKFGAGWTLFTAASGGFVAGLDAGLVYNEWPTMAGSLIPTNEIYLLNPWWKSALEHDVTVQFNHRMIAYGTVALVTSISLYTRNMPLPPNVALAIRCAQLVVLAQATLGICTVLNGVPTGLASAHQGGSLVLLSTMLWLVFTLRTRPSAVLLK